MTAAAANLEGRIIRNETRIEELQRNDQGILELVHEVRADVRNVRNMVIGLLSTTAGGLALAVVGYLLQRGK